MLLNIQHVVGSSKPQSEMIPMLRKFAEANGSKGRFYLVHQDSVYLFCCDDIEVEQMTTSGLLHATRGSLLFTECAPDDFDLANTFILVSVTDQSGDPDDTFKQSLTEALVVIQPGFDPAVKTVGGIKTLFCVKLPDNPSDRAIAEVLADIFSQLSKRLPNALPLDIGLALAPRG